MQDVALGAEEVASKEFPVGFRGFDQHEVRAFLAQVAAELAAARERERLQRERLEAAEARAASRVFSDDDIDAALGQEAGRVLHAAREAAQEIRSRAEEQVARLVRDASGEGSRAQQEAESLLAHRTDEAERVAAEIVADAHRSAEAELQRAKADGRRMVAEAQAVRERVLKDLARRRRAAHQQLEQLRAGRERLLDAYRVVRSTLDEATGELSVAEVEARAAAETASLRMGSLPETTVEELEAELGAARDLGLAPAPPAPPAPTPRREGHAPNGNGAHPQPPEVSTPGGEVEDRSAPAPAIEDPPEPPLDDPTRVPEVEPAPPPAASEMVVPDDEVVPVGEVAPGSPVPPDRGEGRGGVEELFARLRAEHDPSDPETPGGATSADGALSAPYIVDAPDPGDRPDDEQLLQRRDAELDPVEHALVRAFKRTLADEQNEVLDTLRRGRGAASITELLPAASDHTARYLAVIAPELDTAARLGAGGEGNAPTVTDLAVDLAAEVADDLRARLQRAIEAADGDDATLAEGISSAYREWKTSRAEPRARHHCAAANTRGRYSAAHGTLRWVVDDDEGPCPDCDDNALAVTSKGQQFPTGQRHPPAHVGCRCTIVGDPG